MYISKVLVKEYIRNQYGITLPFALILTFIFSSLVGVAYLFVSVNLNQMQSNLQSKQAIAIGEGINEKIKARLNTKSKIKLSPEQEDKLKSFEDEEEEFEDEEEDLLADDEFDEETESFDEYYADEVVKISRYITFREPPPEESTADQEVDVLETQQQEDSTAQAQANVAMIGSVDIPRGVTLEKGIMLVVYKDEKFDLLLKDISPEKGLAFRPKLPAPVIKSLIPNYSEANIRSSFVVNGENLRNIKPRFSNKDIYIEDVRGGPSVEFLVGRDVMPGLTRFYIEGAQAEFYIIPTYNGSSKPIVNEIRNTDGTQFIEAKAGKRLVIMIYGYELYSTKDPTVIIPDVAGIIPDTKEKNPNTKELTLTLNIGKNVEPGVHTLVVATNGGLSNSWLFNVLPAEEQLEEFSTNTATYTSSLTLLDIRVIENLLPLIDEEEEDEEPTKDPDVIDDEPLADDELPEREKLGPFDNTDLETTWLLETTCKIGKITKTISEVIERKIPVVNAALITNGTVNFSGGSYQVSGTTTAMTTLVEPTYISNTLLNVEGPTEEELENPVEPTTIKDQDRPDQDKKIPKSPIELGFQVGSLVAVYKSGSRISELDYAVISKVSYNTIELMPPGLMDFHYQGDEVFQFIPPIIAKEKIQDETAEKHVIPKEFSLSIPNSAIFKNIFMANLEQVSELADLYTNDTNVPKDELDLSLGYMGLSYIEGTPVYNPNNILAGKGILIIDTRSENIGKPRGQVEIIGDSKDPVDFTGIIYIHGNLRIEGNVIINGALIVDNEQDGEIEIANNALGRITFDPGAVKQTILYVPFTTKPGTIMISNKPINLEGYVETGSEIAKLGAGSTFGQTTIESKKTKGEIEVFKKPEEALVEGAESKPKVETIKVAPGGKGAEEELIELF